MIFISRHLVKGATSIVLISSFTKVRAGKILLIPCWRSQCTCDLVLVDLDRVYTMTSRLYRSTVYQWYEEAVQEVERDLSLDISHLERVSHPVIRILLIVRLAIRILLIPLLLSRYYFFLLDILILCTPLFLFRLLQLLSSFCEFLDYSSRNPDAVYSSPLGIYVATAFSTPAYFLSFCPSTYQFRTTF